MDDPSSECERFQVTCGDHHFINLLHWLHPLCTGSLNKAALTRILVGWHHIKCEDKVPINGKGKQTIYDDNDWLTDEIRSEIPKVRFVLSRFWGNQCRQGKSMKKVNNVDAPYLQFKYMGTSHEQPPTNSWLLDFCLEWCSPMTGTIIWYFRRKRQCWESPI